MANVKNLLLIVFCLNVWFVHSGSSSEMSPQEYQEALKKQNKIHHFYRIAKSYEKKGDHKRAVEYYLKAYEINQCAGLISVCRAALAENYEALGEYEKALEHVVWGMDKVEPESSLYKSIMDNKVRLLKKIEAKRDWQSKQNPVVPAFKESFEKASHAEQAAVLSTFGGKGIWEDFKNALVAEHAGNFSEARQIYESLLAKKAEIEKEMGVHGWAMLYPAIQRTSEFLKDKEREKEALIWIQRNLLSPEGEYHASLSKLLPEVVAHIKERLREYNL